MEGAKPKRQYHKQERRYCNTNCFTIFKKCLEAPKASALLTSGAANLGKDSHTAAQNQKSSRAARVRLDDLWNKECLKKTRQGV